MIGLAAVAHGKTAQPVNDELTTINCQPLRVIGHHFQYGLVTMRRHLAARNLLGEVSTMTFAAWLMQMMSLAGLVSAPLAIRTALASCMASAPGPRKR